MAVYEVRADFLHGQLGMPRFDEALVGKDEAEPELDKVVLNSVQAASALFGRILGNGNFPLENPQVDKRLQINGKIRPLYFQIGCDVAELAVAECYRPDDGKVTPDFFHFVLEQEIRFVVKEARFLEHVRAYSLVDVARVSELLHVFGHAARHAVELDQLLAAFSLEELAVVSEGDLPEADLARSASIQGAVVCECLGDHHGD